MIHNCPFFINLFTGSHNFYPVYSIPFCWIKNFEPVGVKHLEHWTTQVAWSTRCFLQVAPSVVYNLYSNRHCLQARIKEAALSVKEMKRKHQAHVDVTGRIPGTLHRCGCGWGTRGERATISPSLMRLLLQKKMWLKSKLCRWQRSLSQANIWMELVRYVNNKAEIL